MIHLDTSFLVDLLREGRSGAGGPATSRLEDLADIELRVSVHALCELFAGVELSTRSAGERQAVEALIAGLEVVYPDAGFAPTYGRLLAPLQRAGRLISTTDLLIATAAVQDGAPIVTGNPAHFERISELEIVTLLASRMGRTLRFAGGDQKTGRSWRMPPQPFSWKALPQPPV